MSVRTYVGGGGSHGDLGVVYGFCLYDRHRGEKKRAERGENNGKIKIGRRSRKVREYNIQRADIVRVIRR